MSHDDDILGTLRLEPGAKLGSEINVTSNGPFYVARDHDRSQIERFMPGGKLSFCLNSTDGWTFTREAGLGVTESQPTPQSGCMRIAELASKLYQKELHELSVIVSRVSNDPSDGWSARVLYAPEDLELLDTAHETADGALEDLRGELIDRARERERLLGNQIEELRSLIRGSRQ